MNGAPDLTLFSMFMSGLLLLIPLFLVWYFKMGIFNSLLISTFRMAIQLFLIGFFLEYLFKYNQFIINVLWFTLMITVAVFSVIKNSNLNIKHFFLPVFVSFALANFFVVLYFNTFI